MWGYPFIVVGSMVHPIWTIKFMWKWHLNNGPELTILSICHSNIISFVNISLRILRYINFIVLVYDDDDDDDDDDI